MGSCLLCINRRTLKTRRRGDLPAIHESIWFKTNAPHNTIAKDHSVNVFVNIKVVAHFPMSEHVKNPVKEGQAFSDPSAVLGPEADVD